MFGRDSLALLVLSSLAATSVSGMTTVMDATGKMMAVPGEAASGIVTVVTSPGIPSLLLSDDDADGEVDDAHLSVTNEGTMFCRGLTLGMSDAISCDCLAVCSTVSDAIILEGITMGDVEAGLRNSRHSRTLTALFRSRTIPDSSITENKQTLILSVMGDSDDDDVNESRVEPEIQTLFKAVTVGNKAKSFNDLYDLLIVPVTPLTVSKVLALATDAAKASSTESKPLSSTLQNALRHVRESGVENAAGLEPPQIANAFVSVGNASLKQSRAARAKIAVWKSRVARGLLVDGFGKDATSLRKRVLGTFDAETLSAAGLPMVATYRLAMRSQLQQLVDTAIQQVFAGQVTNLEKSTLKHFNVALLKTVDSKDSVESVMGTNSATLRKEALLFETVMDDLEVPALGLTKDKATREVSSKLNDALNAFPDSPAAKLQRMQEVKKVVSKEKKPGERSVSFGLDLVAMLRPDGFGSMQGFAGYQLPGGNSITFGVHNDADDPQVIAQFGGVRPPLLKVQPKLRVDVEM